MTIVDGRVGGDDSDLGSSVEHAPQVICLRSVRGLGKLFADLGLAVGATLGIAHHKALVEFVVALLADGVFRVFRVLRKVLGQRGYEEVLVLQAFVAKDSAGCRGVISTDCELRWQGFGSVLRSRNVGDVAFLNCSLSVDVQTPS